VIFRARSGHHRSGARATVLISIRSEIEDLDRQGVAECPQPLSIHRATASFALLGGLLTVSALAVEPGLPSKTSILAASLRAVGARNPDPDFRNPDHLAIKFLGPRERALLDDQLLGGEVQVMNAGAECCLHDGNYCIAKGSCAIDDSHAAGDGGIEEVRLLHVDKTRLQFRIRGAHGAQLCGVAAGKDWCPASFAQFRNDEAPGVPVGTKHSHTMASVMTSAPNVLRRSDR
jgi:hypothetical protein